MDYSILLTASAGQGVETIETLLSKALKEAGFFVFSDKEYMSRVRGGMNSTTIRVSSNKNKGYKQYVDFLFIFNKGALEHSKNRITKDTVIFGEKEFIDNIDSSKFCEVNFLQAAKALGNAVFANTIALGFISAMFKLEENLAENMLKEHFIKDDIVKSNIVALKKGYELFQDLKSSQNLELKTEKYSKTKVVLMSGSQSVALGAIAANAKFLSFYPMSPSTDVAIFLAHQTDKFDIIVEQFEDEIAAANAAIGSWFGGVRSFVTTSGGGYALMEEAISLAAMSETPIVVHLAQRPAPATGLPTRTAQSDLNLVLYSSHGDFPRVIFTPRNLEDSFFLSQKAFDVAEAYQIPVYILTDQYFMSMLYAVEKEDLDFMQVKNYIIETQQNYKRYEFTQNGVSKRGIPGFGEGIVVANGNEHDEYGDITEDEELTQLMLQKRMKKLDLLKEESLPPLLYGPEDFKHLIVCFGSLYENTKESLELLNSQDTALLSFSQVYPINEVALKYFRQAQKLIFIEQNYSGQFAALVYREFGIKASKILTKYTGRQFFVEELKDRIEKALEEK